MHTRKFGCFASLWLLTAAMPITSHGADCNDGLAAYTASNYQKAADILHPLADQGNDCAQYQLGVMYLRGEGVPKSESTAKALLSAAAKKENGAAKWQLELLNSKPETKAH